MYEGIQRAEAEYEKYEVLDIEKELKKQGWSLDYIYLDRKANRYSVQQDEIDLAQKDD